MLTGWMSESRELSRMSGLGGRWGAAAFDEMGTEEEVRTGWKLFPLPRMLLLKNL